MFIAVAGHTERRPFFLGASWTFVALDPGEVLWGTGAQEGIVGKQQLDKWCKLLAEHGLESRETRIREHWRADAANRCCICASWIGRAPWYHSIHCRGAGSPTIAASWNDEETPS